MISIYLLLDFPSWIKFVNPLENLESTGKSSIFRLKICIFKLQICIFRLQICIFSLKIDFWRGNMDFFPRKIRGNLEGLAYFCMLLVCLFLRVLWGGEYVLELKKVKE